MAQVIDASVAIAWCARSQATPVTEAALSAVADTGGHAPAIFWFEVLYGLAGLEHRSIIPRADVDEFAERIAQFALRVDRAHQVSEIIDLHHLARRYALNIYDAAYLELSLRLSLPLATRDAHLARAATKAGVALFNPDQAS